MKYIISFTAVVTIILLAFTIKYLDYKETYNDIKKYNIEYEMYLNKLITGRELTTVINKAVDNNEKNKVSKDKNGFYLDDNENSINIDVKILDNDTIYKMETFYSGGMITFIQYYGDISFECTKIEYNNKGKVKYMVFEQKTN